jgi:hypothetical protein
LSHATKTIGEALLKTDVNKLSNAEVQEAAGVAGDVVAAILRRLDAGINDAERTQLALTAGQCERIVQQGARKLGSAERPYSLDETLKDGKDAEFRKGAEGMFKDLTGAPFGRDASRYPKP